MTRVRAMLLLSAFGVSATAARCDDADWKPADPKPIPTEVKPAPAPVPVEAKPADPTPVPVEVMPADGSGWRPAKAAPVPEPQPATPLAPAPVPAEPVTVPTFRPTSTDHSAPATAEPPKDATPGVLPPIQPIPKLVNQDVPKPAEPLKPVDPPRAELLPPPRPSDPPSVPPIPTVPPPSGVTVKLADDCPPAPPLPGDPNCPPAVGGVPPVRGRVFGSPGVTLSRDYAFRDLFGLDLLTPRGVGVGPDGSVVGGADLWFFQAEYLLWWVNKPNIPVLATTSASGTGFGFAGDPDTRNLLGPGGFGPGLRHGFRARAGGYFDECTNLGVDGSFFFLGRARETAVFDSSEYPVITRPFFAPNQGVLVAPGGNIGLPGEFGEVVARPGLSAGRLEVEQESFLWGADANVRKAICRTCTGAWGWFAGYRHLNLDEQLTITEFLTATGADAAPDPVGTRVVVQDSFRTRNRFHGGQVGYFWNRQIDRWVIDARASVAVGGTQQIVEIDGFQQRTRPGEATQTFRGGLLAAGPNIGRFTDSRFSVVPEATLNVGYQITPAVRVYGGYNFLYWSNVVRPGDQIDRVVDVTFVPNPPANLPPSGQIRPQPTFTQSNLWAQGVQFGLELRW